MSVTAGNKITAGELTTLLNKVKAEFAKRANPYTTNRLDKYGSGLTLSPTDTKNSKISSDSADDVLSAAMKIKNNDSSYDITAGTKITADLYNTVESFINTLAGYSATAANRTGCAGGC